MSRPRTGAVEVGRQVRLILAQFYRGGGKTGMAMLDHALKPLRGGELIVIAGRPSMGKSGLGVCIAENVALHAGTVGLWSLEMSRLQLARDDSPRLSSTSRVW